MLAATRRVCAGEAPQGTTLIERLVPRCVAAVEAWGEIDDAKLFPEEELVVQAALPARRAEFTTARACARRALGQLGAPAGAIPAGGAGEPHWPAGYLGSITHCRGYRASAVARSQDARALGIDAEPDLPLPRGVLRRIALPAELLDVNERRAGSYAANRDCLLFCAKEAALKAWFPLTGRRLGLKRILVAIDYEAQTLTASQNDPGVPPHLAPPLLRGAWQAACGLITVAFTLR